VSNARFRLRSDRTKLATTRSAFRALARQGSPRRYGVISRGQVFQWRQNSTQARTYVNPKRWIRRPKFRAAPPCRACKALAHAASRRGA
jgi:hypothetical protein